jgi:hypothetical protein
VCFPCFVGVQCTSLCCNCIAITDVRCVRALSQWCECPEQLRPPPAVAVVGSATGGDKSDVSDADAVNNSSGDDADRAGDEGDSDSKSDSTAEVECYTCPTCSSKVS